ncbi:hypothetical protein HMPREF1978_01517 [Actinomyces graevenitzii F0530]|uniref:Uncharacterized protein n=2 Tax=Actinomyces graevenitzii TaxID=55565 RepID=U1PXN6_9ACTO|nr:hypothetical protein HMPREF1978_01517 [Actinomyces graevenitzii F0530]
MVFQAVLGFALAVAISFYLLPHLRRRDRLAVYSHDQDRYSPHLRVLNTAMVAGKTPGHANNNDIARLIFSPEVKVMNRPAVRNVRAARLERDLAKAKRAQAAHQAKASAAAKTRRILMGSLAGVTVLLGVLAGVFTWPWFVVLPTAALLAAAMVGDVRVRRVSSKNDAALAVRVSQLEEQLEGVGRSAKSVKEAKAKREAEIAVRKAKAEAARREAARLREQEVAAARKELAEQERQARESAEETDVRQREQVAKAKDQLVREAKTATEAKYLARLNKQAEAKRAEEVAKPAAKPATQVEPAAKPTPTVAKPAASTTVSASAAAKPVSAAKATSADSAGDVVETAKAAPKAASATKWEPVNVPAPSYTMAARGPRRRVVEAEADFNSAKEVTGVVNPVRPSSAPANVSLDVESVAGDFKPIDLDAVLERRRAAGE